MMPPLRVVGVADRLRSARSLYQTGDGSPACGQHPFVHAGCVVGLNRYVVGVQGVRQPGSGPVRMRVIAEQFQLAR